MRKYCIFTMILPLIAGCSLQRTDLHLADLFTDNLVLQQSSTAPIWGWATPGSRITVHTSWGEEARVTTSAKGKWMVELSTPATKADPHSMTVAAKDTAIVLKNVLLGEVWVCSGQSNMEMPVSGWLPNDPIDHSEKEIEAADYPAIRMFTVKRNKSFTPLDTCSGSWEICNPENVPGFSATAYFFGRSLHQKLGVPVGLIHSSWSGSPARSWVDVDFVEKVEGYEDIIQRIAETTDGSTEFNKWLASMKKVP